VNWRDALILQQGRREVKLKEARSTRAAADRVLWIVVRRLTGIACWRAGWFPGAAVPVRDGAGAWLHIQGDDPRNRHPRRTGRCRHGQSAALTSCPESAYISSMGTDTAATIVEGSGSSEILGRIRDLLVSQRLGVLGTHFEDAPHQSLVAFVASKDLREIYFASPARTRKAEALRKDARVALLVDNRKNLDSDFDASLALTAKGSAELLSKDDTLAVAPLYVKRHPSLQEFAASPSCRFYRIRVQSYSLVSRFQHVEELLLG
jgi:nitroimidazol reductase NimA-like FMN-containing flavoprotein (pyridoxamine 5'-phosphate oxidase superfamily)